MSFTILLRKEIKEQVKTYRLLIVVAVFLLFGLSTPLMLKYLPDILKLSGEQIPIQIPAFAAADSLKSYLGNLGQVGVLVAVLVGMGSIAQERERGTAVMTLCKPVGFGAFALAKLTALVLTLAVGLALGALGCYFYTVLLLGNVDGPSFILMNLLVAAYFVVCLSVTLMYSAFFKSQLAAGALALVSLIGAALVGSIPLVGQYSPNALMSWARGLATGRAVTFWPALVVSGLVVVASLLAGWQMLRTKEL